MEIERDEPDKLIQSRETYKLPKSFRIYSFNYRNQNIKVLPINNVLVDDDVEYYLDRLNNTLGTNRFDPLKITSDQVMKLPSNIRGDFIGILKGDILPPIRVSPDISINEPSLFTPEQSSVLGIDRYEAAQPNRIIDKLYKPINNQKLLALSIYFNCDHVPVIVEY